MSNAERYDKVFAESLNLQPEDLNEGLVYNSVALWDSVGHMSLMASLEAEFDIMLETDDIIAFSSYDKGKDILTKYSVKF